MNPLLEEHYKLILPYKSDQEYFDDCFTKSPEELKNMCKKIALGFRSFSDIDLSQAEPPTYLKIY